MLFLFAFFIYPPRRRNFTFPDLATRNISVIDGAIYGPLRVVPFGVAYSLTSLVPLDWLYILYCKINNSQKRQTFNAWPKICQCYYHSAVRFCVRASNSRRVHWFNTSNDILLLTFINVFYSKESCQFLIRFHVRVSIFIDNKSPLDE